MSGGYGFSHSSAPVKTVKEIQFGILSPEEIVRPASPSLAFLFPLPSFSLLLASRTRHKLILSILLLVIQPFLLPCLYVLVASLDELARATV
jgi:hypothetical protein